MDELEKILLKAEKNTVDWSKSDQSLNQTNRPDEKSIDSVLNSLLSKVKPNIDAKEFLKERDWDDLAENSDSDMQTQMASVIAYTEEQLGQTLSKNKVQSNAIKGIARSSSAEEQLLKLLRFIEDENKDILDNPDLIEVKLGIDLSHRIKEIPKILLGQFDYNYIAYDTEANKVGDTVINTAVHYQAKRIVVNALHDVETCTMYKIKDFPDWQLYIITSKNLWDANMLGDFETTLACILLSCIHQDQEDLIAIYNEIKRYKIVLDTTILEELLRKTRQSFWICHNNGYDIPKLNHTHRTGKKGKRNKFSIIKPFELKFFTYNSSSHELYSIKMGNITPSFRFKANNDKRWSFIGTPQITLAPRQQHAFSLVSGIDTLILAKSNQQAGKLEEISINKDLFWKKMVLEDDKNFDIKDVEIQADGSITDKLRYNILDCLATLDAFGELAQDCNLSHLYETLGMKQKLTVYSPLTRIISASTQPKQIIFDYIAMKTGLRHEDIKDNFEKQRAYFDNYKDTYYGGTTDAEVGKQITADNIAIDDLEQMYQEFVDTGNMNANFKNKKLINYCDYRSQYPHASWLINAELKFILSAKNELHEHINTDLDEIKKDFFKHVKYRIDNPYEPFKKEFFNKFDGNATIKLKVDLKFRRSYKGKHQKSPTKTNVIIKSGSTITASLLDIGFALIEYYHRTAYPKNITKLIHFISAERIDLPEPDEHGSELLTKLFLLRIEFEEKLGKHHPTPKKLKILMNIIYGLTAEGKSKDYIGKLMLFVISNPITTLSRFFTNYTKLVYKLKKSKALYNDTDSVVALATAEIHELVRNLFINTINFEYEKDVAYKTIKSADGKTSINLQLISDVWIAGKKKYGVKHWILYCIDCKKQTFKFSDKDECLHSNIEGKFVIYAKKHGVGQHSGDEKHVDETYQYIYGELIKGNSPEQIADYLLPTYKFWSNVSNKAEKGNAKTINDLLKEKEVFNFTYDAHDLPVYVHHRPEKKWVTCDGCKREDITDDDYIWKNGKKYTSCCETKYKINKTEQKFLISNIKNFSKGSFGSFYILNEEIYFFIVGDIKNDFKEICLFSLYKMLEAGIIPELTKYENEEINWIELMETLPDVRKKLTEKATTNISHFSFEIKQDHGQYWDMMPYTMKRKVSDTPLLMKTDFKRKIDCDGWEISADCYLPKPNFTSKLVSDASKYYSQSIQMFAYMYSKFYYEKEYKSEDVKKQKIANLLNMSLDQYPICKRNNNIEVPFKIRRFWFEREIPDGTLIPENELLMSLEPTEIKKLCTPYTYSDKEVDDRVHLQEGLSTNTFSKKYRFDKEKKYGEKEYDLELKFTQEVNREIKETKNTLKMKHSFETELLCLYYVKDRKAYLVVDNYKLLQKMDRIEKKSFWLGKWMGKHFSFELVSKNRDPASVNATLRIRVLVGGNTYDRNLENFHFHARLRVNPTQRGLYNFDLFNTTVDEVVKNSYIIRELLLTAIDRYKKEENQILQYFSRKNSLTESDLKQKKDKTFFIESTWMVLCYENLKESLKSLRYKLHNIAITKNIQLDLDPIVIKRLQENMYSIMNTVIDRYVVNSKTAEETAQKIRQLKISHHGGSDGFTINNYFNNSAMSMYIKNKKQFISKLARTTIDNYTSLLKAVKRSVLVEDFREDIFRIEITIWDYKAILQNQYYELLEKLEQFILKLADNYKNKEDSIIKEYNVFLNEFSLDAEDLMINWLTIHDLEAENNKWNKILDKNYLDQMIKDIKPKIKRRKKKRPKPPDPPDQNQTVLNI